MEQVSIIEEKNQVEPRGVEVNRESFLSSFSERGSKVATPLVVEKSPIKLSDE